MIHRKSLSRFVAFVLAVVILIAPGTTVSAANIETGKTGTKTSSSSSTLADLLSAVKYDVYFEKYSAVATDAETSFVIEGDALYDFCYSYLGDESSPYGYAYKNTFLTDEKGNTITENGDPVPLFVMKEEDKNPNYKDKQMSVVKEIEGKECVFLPASGAVEWKIDVPETALYAIDMEYFAYDGREAESTGVDAKTTGIERSFFVNGKVPFYEARFLSLTKTWIDDEKSYQLDENGNVVMTKDASGNEVPQFKQDINKNEIKPTKIQKSEWRNYSFTDSTGYHSTPLKFYFEKGENVIALDAQREALYVSSIRFYPYKGLENSWTAKANGTSYADYLEYYKDAKDYSGEALKIQAEYPLATSETTIYATNDRSSSITEPQSASRIYLNSIGGEGGEKWLTIGQWARYQIEVPETGFYSIVLRYKQSVLAGTFSSRILRVKLPGDDLATVPFDEAYNLQFNYDDDWQKDTITDGTTEFKIYLEKGVNEIELEASFGNMTEILSRVGYSLQTINDIYIKLLSITGAEPDSNRDYGFYDIMPDEVDELLNQSEELFAIAELFEEITGTSGSHSKTLETIARLLEKMGKDDSKIARNMGNLKENLGTLGTWLQQSMQQPLQIDYISFQSPSAKVGKATDNFFQALWYEICQFVQSFLTDYNTLGAVEKVDGDNVVEVWTTLGRDQAQIIRNLITNDFNNREGNNGKSVVLKLVAGGSLLPSVLAGVGPDVSLGHGAGDVINWAIRSAVVNVDQFEGYDEVASWFSDAAIVPLTLQELYWSKDLSASEKEGAYTFTAADKEGYNKYVENGGTMTLAQYAYSVARNEHNAFTVLYNDVDRNSGEETEYAYKRSVYGLPETQSFAVMFYRADILSDLGMTPPKTWDELIAMIPDLQNNHMEIAFPTSLGGLNMFLYQMGGGLYEDDGRRIGLDTDTALTAFDYLCQFFQQYSFPVSYSFVNRFRSGEMPIGIADYTTYTQLSVYATEIKGLWEFIPLPGYITGYTTDAEGNKQPVINNTSVSGVSADIMLVDSKREDEMTEFAWEFMKWFVGEKTQKNYADELTALLGSVSKHNTANIKALDSLPWTTSEYTNLKAQFNNLSAVPEYPGGYIISRYVNFAFLAVVNNNADAEESMLGYIVEINKELTRKRQEFGMAYYDITYSTNFTEEKSN